MKKNDLINFSKKIYQKALIDVKNRLTIGAGGSYVIPNDSLREINGVIEDRNNLSGDKRQELENESQLFIDILNK